MVIERISETLAGKMKNIAGNEIKYELDELEFGLKVIFNTVAIIIFSLILGIIFHIITSAVATALVAFVSLRILTGGYHLKSSDYCVIVSTLIIFLIVEFSKYLNGELILYATILSTLSILIFAPKNMIIYYLRSDKKLNNQLLKFISLFIVVLSYFLHNNIISLAFLIQCLTLIPKQEEER